MHRSISRSTPYLPRYQSVSPARSPLGSRRFSSPRSTSQPSQRIVYIDNAPSRVINSYHARHSPSPNRTYRIHLFSPKKQLIRVTRSQSACDINSSHVYTSQDEICVRSLKESTLRQVGSSEDIYHAVPFFPDVTPSESGVSFGDWEEGSTFGGEDDNVSQHSFGSSSAFCEVTIDSELDKCDSDNFSGPDYIGDRALSILPEHDSDTNYEIKKRRSRRSNDGLENRDYKAVRSVSDTKSRKNESSQSWDYNKFQTQPEALSVLIPDGEVSGKINGDLDKVGSRGIGSTPLAHSTPHVSPGGPGESKLCVVASWDADAIGEAMKSTEPKTSTTTRTLSGQGSDTRNSSRFEDSSCNSSCSEDNYSDVSNVTTSSPIIRKTKLVKKHSDKPVSSKKPFESHGVNQSDFAHARAAESERDQQEQHSASEDVKQRNDRPKYTLNDRELRQDQQKLTTSRSDNTEQTDKPAAGNEWWASYNTDTTTSEVISRNGDTEKSLAFRRVSADAKPLAVNIPLITAGIHGQEKLRKLSRMSPPLVSPTHGSLPVVPNDRPNFEENEKLVAEHLVTHDIEDERHAGGFVKSDNIQNHKCSEDSDEQPVSTNLHQDLLKTSRDTTENRSFSGVEDPTSGEICELELYSGSKPSAEERVHDWQKKVNENARALSYATEKEGAIAEREAGEIKKLEPAILSLHTVAVSTEPVSNIASIQSSSAASIVYRHSIADNETVDVTCEDSHHQIAAQSPIEDDRESTRETLDQLHVTKHVPEHVEDIGHLRHSTHVDIGVPGSQEQCISKQDNLDDHQNVISLEENETGQDGTQIVEYMVDNTLTPSSDSTGGQELHNGETSSGLVTSSENVDAVLFAKNSYALNACDSDSCSPIKDIVLSDIVPETAVTVVAAENIVKPDHQFSDSVPTVSSVNSSIIVENCNFENSQARGIDANNVGNTTDCRDAPQVVLRDVSSQLFVDFVKPSNTDLDQGPDKTPQSGNSLSPSCSDDNSPEVITPTSYKSPTSSLTPNSLEQQFLHTLEECTHEALNTNSIVASESSHIEDIDWNTPKTFLVESTDKQNDVVIVVDRSSRLVESSTRITAPTVNADNQVNYSVIENSSYDVGVNSVTDKAIIEAFATTDKEIFTTTAKEVFTPTDKEIITPTDKQLFTTTDKEILTPTDKKVFTTTDKELFTTTDKEVFTPTDKELFTTTDKELFTTTDKEVFTPTNKEVFTPTDKEVFTSTDKEIFTTTVNEVFTPTDKEIFTPTKEIFTTTDKEAFTPTDKEILTAADKEIFASTDKEILPTTDKETFLTTDKDYIVVTPEESCSEIRKENTISTETESVHTCLSVPSIATSGNVAPVITYGLSHPALAEQVNIPPSALSTSCLNIEPSFTHASSSVSSTGLAETSFPSDHFLTSECDQENVTETVSGLDFTYRVSSPVTSVSKLEAEETFDSTAHTSEATVYPNNPLDKLQVQLSLLSGDTGLTINADRAQHQVRTEAPDNFQNIAHIDTCDFVDFSKDPCKSIDERNFLAHTNGVVILRDELDNSVKADVNSNAGSHVVRGCRDSDYDNVTTSDYDNVTTSDYDNVTTSMPMEPQLYTRPRHLHLLQFAHTKTSDLWALQEETESAMNTPSPKQPCVTFVNEEDSSNLHSCYSPRIIHHNSTEQNVQDDQIKMMLNGQTSLVSDSSIVEKNKDKWSALSSAESNSVQFENGSEDILTLSEIKSVGVTYDDGVTYDIGVTYDDGVTYDAGILGNHIADDESGQSEISPASTAHRETPEIKSGVFRAQLVNISPGVENTPVNLSVDADKNAVSQLGTFTSNLGLSTNSSTGKDFKDTLSSLDALSASLKQFNIPDIDTGDRKPLPPSNGSSSPPDSGNYDFSSVRAYEIERSRDEDNKAASYLPTHNLDLFSASTTEPATETNNGSVYTCTGTAEIKETPLNDNPVHLPETNFRPVYKKTVLNHKLTNAKIKQFEKILYEFNKGLRTSQDITDFLFFCDNYADYTDSSASSSEALYKYFTNDDSEKVQNHTCITVEDEDMNSFRFKRYLKKSHAKRNNGRKILRFLSKLSCVSETLSSPIDKPNGKVKNADKDAQIFSTDSMTNPRMRISSPVLISSTSFQLHNILNSSPMRYDSNGNTSFDSTRTSADSAYSSLSEPSMASLSSPAFPPTPATSESVSSVFNLDLTTGDWTFSDNVFANTSDAALRTSFVKNVRNQPGGQNKDTMFSLSDERHHFNFSENEIDGALLNRLRYGHVPAELN